MGRLLAADVLLAGLQREDEAAAAVDVARLAGDPARHAADVLLGRGEEAERGAAEVEPVAERLALAERRRRRRTRRAASGRPSAIGSPATTTSAPASLAGAASASRSSTAPRKLGCWTKTAAVSSSTASASAAASVTPSSSPTSTTSAPKPAAVGGERLAAVRVDAARDDEASAPGRARSRGRRRRRPTRAPRRAPAFATGSPVSSEIAVWNSNIACSAALGDLGLVGRVRGQELRARGDRVDDRRHVVVVHAGAEEAELGLGVGVARRERAQALVDLASPPCPAGRSSGRSSRTSAGISLEQLVDRAGADRGEHLLAVGVGRGGVRRPMQRSPISSSSFW